MNKVLVIAFVLLIGGACTTKEIAQEDSELIGIWRLVEMYDDPGDGSGSFTNVTSDKTIEFKIDGTITANGELCVLSAESNASVIGTYTVSDSTISTPNCTTLTFEQSGNELIIKIPCDEPCLAKFRKE